jgi:ABC-type nitrate/sulfonate/bicarbonate transport system permease component
VSFRTLQVSWNRYGGYALGFASLFVLWHLASIYLVSSVLFPPPAVVFRKAVVLVRNGVLLEHLWASVQRILVGFIAGSARCGRCWSRTRSSCASSRPWP